MTSEELKLHLTNIEGYVDSAIIWFHEGKPSAAEVNVHAAKGYLRGLRREMDSTDASASLFVNAIQGAMDAVEAIT